jgi:hypothetical protein
MHLTDEERESIIAEFQRLCEVGTPAVRRYYWSHMQNLIHGRSAAQVERMERERGLLRGHRTVAA